MKRFLMTLGILLPLNTYALTPGEVQAIVQQAQESVQTLPQTQEEDIAIAIAVSLSMPRASLLKLGQDAWDAGLTLTFRGVGTEFKTDRMKNHKLLLNATAKDSLPGTWRTLNF